MAWNFIEPMVLKRIEEGFRKININLLPGRPAFSGRSSFPGRPVLRYRHLRITYREDWKSKSAMYKNLVLGYSWEVQSLLLLERSEHIPLEKSVVMRLLEGKARRVRDHGLILYEEKSLRNRYQFAVVLKELALKIGQEINLRELARLARCHVNTVKKHLSILESEGVVYRLGGFRRVSDVEIGERFKVYFWDLGLRNALVGDFSGLNDREDAAILWENFFINERIKMFDAPKSQHISVQFYFWRHRKLPAKQVQLVEVFEDGRMNAFQICWVSQPWLEKVGVHPSRPDFTPFFRKHYSHAECFLGVPKYMLHHLVVPDGNYFTIIGDVEWRLIPDSDWIQKPYCTYVRTYVQ